MQKWLSVAVFWLIMAAFFVSVPAHSVGSQSQQQATANFTLYVSQYGYNGTAGVIDLGPVAQGEYVTITFVWNDTDSAYSSHQFEISGYNLTSDVIDAQSLRSSIAFTADVAGTFRIYCTLPCLGMDNMQNATLIVNTSEESTTTSSHTSGQTTGSGTSAGNSTSVSTTQNATTVVSANSSQSALQLTTLNVTSMQSHDGVLDISVDLTNIGGDPVRGVTIHFYTPTDFGMLSIGSNVTVSNGTAYFAYRLPTVWNGTVYASFAGNKAYAPSNSTAVLQGDPPASISPASPYVSGQANFVDTRLVGVPGFSAEVVVGLFVLIICCVYATMVFVIMNVLGIRRKKKE